eukprot:m51a1_g9479 putative adenylate guanylate cyclase (983) ;mRNA; r:598833-605513
MTFYAVVDYGFILVCLVEHHRTDTYFPGIAFLILTLVHASNELPLRLSIPVTGAILVGDVVAAIMARRQTFLGIEDLDHRCHLRKEEHKVTERLVHNLIPEAIIVKMRSSKARGKINAEYVSSASVLVAELRSVLTSVSLVELLNELFTEFDVLCQQCGVTKIKAIGGLYVVASNIGSCRSDHSRALVQLAPRMQAIVTLLNRGSLQRAPISMWFGVHTGPLIAGVIRMRHPQFDCWGEAITVAESLRLWAKRDCLLVTRPCLEHASQKDASASVFDRSEKSVRLCGLEFTPATPIKSKRKDQDEKWNLPFAVSLRPAAQMARMVLAPRIHRGEGYLRYNVLTLRFTTAAVELAFSRYRTATTKRNFLTMVWTMSLAMALGTSSAVGIAQFVPAVVATAVLGAFFVASKAVRTDAAREFVSDWTHVAAQTSCALGWLITVMAVNVLFERGSVCSTDNATITFASQIAAVTSVSAFFRSMPWFVRLGVSLLIFVAPQTRIWPHCGWDFMVDSYLVHMVLCCIVVWTFVAYVAESLDREEFKNAFEGQKERDRLDREKKTYELLVDSLLPAGVIQMFKARTENEVIAQDHQNAVLLHVEVAGFEQLTPHEAVTHLGSLFDCIDQMCDRAGQAEMSWNKVMMTLQFKTKLGSAFISSKDETIFVKGCGKIEMFELLEYDPDHGTISRLLFEASSQYASVRLLNPSDSSPLGSPVPSPALSPVPQSSVPSKTGRTLTAADLSTRKTLATPPLHRTSVQTHGADRRVLCFVCGTMITRWKYVEHELKCLSAETKAREALSEDVRKMSEGIVRPSVPLPEPGDASVEYMSYNSEAKQKYNSSLFKCGVCSGRYSTSDIASHVGCCRGSPVAFSSKSGVQSGVEVVCYLCGGKTSVDEAIEHYTACLVKQVPVRSKFSLPMPTPPAHVRPTPSSPLHEFLVYNNEARAAYLKGLPRCDRCHSTCNLFEYEKHTYSCQGESLQSAGTVAM